MPFLNVGDQKIYYSESGSGSTSHPHPIPIVFVHGAAGSHMVWGFQLRALGEIGRTVAMDLPGHGRSDLPGRNTVDDYGDVILRFLDALNFNRAVIVGHSMGGAIAQTIALSHPDRVAGLGLIGTGARLRVLPAILEGVLTDVNAIAPLVVDNSYAANLASAMRERAIAEFVACPAEITHGDFTACNAFDIMPRIGDIHAPTIVICGREDRMTPFKYSEFLASKITNAWLVLIERAGHSVMIEQADQVNRALEEFIRSLNSPSNEAADNASRVS